MKYISNNEDKGLSRQLGSRHIAMIALGGSIGTGLFLASGAAIHEAGPGGAILAFLVVGLMVYFLMTSLGEMSAVFPVTGSFCDYCARFVDPAFGFAMSYNYWFNWAVTIAVDLSAATIIMKFWYPHVPTLDWSLLFFSVIFLLNMLSVSVYGEIEYWFSAIKVSTIIIFLIVGLLVLFGVIGKTHVTGFHNWFLEGGSPFQHGVMGSISVLLMAGFSFQGTEIFGVIAGEAKNPQKSIPKAIKHIFWRILFFYILSITVISLIIPSTDPNLLNVNNNVILSPFTILFEKAGFKYAADAMNFVILTAVLSAANASMYTATRTLWNMSKKRIAPNIFSRLTKKGCPLYALLLSAGIGAVTFLSSFLGNGRLFVWLISLSSLSGFIAWFGISISHYRFRKIYLQQGNKLSDLPYKSKFFPIGPIFALVLCVLVILGQQLTSEGHFNWSGFLSTYLTIPVFLALYIGYKFFKKSKIVSYENPIGVHDAIKL